MRVICSLQMNVCWCAIASATDAISVGELSFLNSAALCTLCTFVNNVCLMGSSNTSIFRDLFIDHCVSSARMEVSCALCECSSKRVEN